MENENHNINPDLEWDLIPTVHIQSGEFSADVIKLYELPHKMVNEAMSAQGGPEQMTAMLEVFRLAVVDPKNLAPLEYMSFTNVVEVLSQWTMKSSKQLIGGPMVAIESRKMSDIEDEDLEQVLRNIAEEEGVHISEVDMNRISEVLGLLMEVNPKPKKKRRKFFGNKKNNNKSE
jgi:hypothetical protein